MHSLLSSYLCHTAYDIFIHQIQQDSQCSITIIIIIEL